MEGEHGRASLQVGPASTTEQSIRHAVEGLDTATGLADGLPRLLLALNAELLACQNRDHLSPLPDATNGDGPGSSIIAARYALTEATTAALTLVRRLADADRHLRSSIADGDIDERRPSRSGR